MHKVNYFGRILFCSILFVVLISCGDSNNKSNNSNGTLSKARITKLPPPDTLTATPAHLPSFIAFESGQVRPMALSENGQHLFAVNTPNNSLEVYAVENLSLTHQYSIAVGMEPVSVATVGDNVWVVNHLSDSVSIINMSLSIPVVVKTLLVGDEPRDIIFAGSENKRAFITTAHRGQNSPVNPSYTTPGISRADVWVFDSTNLGDSLGGDPVTIVNLFGDTPRALAKSVDNSEVYVAIFNSGNKTTSVHQVETSKKGLPMDNVEGVVAPKTGHILQYRNGHWRDETNRTFDQETSLNLPDYDVFTIDANAVIPLESSRVSGVGTTLFNMAVNPANGNIFVTNTNANNHIRFEGPGNRGSTVTGSFIENRISIIDDNQVTIRPLNKHINQASDNFSAEEKAASISMPLGSSFTQDGRELYLAAMGSNKISVLDVEKLESNEFDPKLQISIMLTGGGPTAVVLDEVNRQAFALTRYDNGISIIDMDSKSESDHLTMFSPEPDSIVLGRPFLYDADLTSSSGTMSCGGCHIFADTDHLAWDLGNPDEVMKDDPHPVVPFSNPVKGEFTNRTSQFHPMKGPKSTQSLRGMANHGPLHWRGDRTGVNRVNGESKEEAAFKEFNTAFEGLVGRDAPLSEEQMQAFTDFSMQLSYPPNPNRPLSNQLTPDQQEGFRAYTQLATSGNFSSKDNTNLGCNSCHILQPENGRYGTSDNQVTVLGANSQDYKVPHFRNLYQKVGFFRRGQQSRQIRGFGFSQNGATANLMDLLGNDDFTFETTKQSSQLADFLFAYDTLLAPIVGQQITIPTDNMDAAMTRIDLLLERAQVQGNLPECDLIVKGVWNGERRGAVRLDSDIFQSDKHQQTYSLAELKALADDSGNKLSFMCVPPNSGVRMGIDQDLDGILDGDAS